MSTALAMIQPEELDTIQRTGKMLAASGYFDGKGDSVQSIAMMATKILAGREIGIGPFAAVNGIHIISGKPSIGANLLASAVKGSGRYDYRVREMTDKVCRIEFFQREGEKWESLGISEFTADEAKKAQTKNMDKFPKNMLFARAMSNGVRFYTPDVFNGNAVYVPEELGANVDGNGEVIESTWNEFPTDSQQDEQPQSDTPPTVAEWLSQPQLADVANAAKAWAVEVGACKNDFEAKASLKKIVDMKFGGIFRQSNSAEVLTAFYLRQQGKLSKALEEITVEGFEPEGPSIEDYPSIF